MFFFGDDHGGEAVVGRRDAYWASGGSAVTNSLLLSAVSVVGAVFADRNAPALGGILNQQGVGNLMIASKYFKGDKPSSLRQLSQWVRLDQVPDLQTSPHHPLAMDLPQLHSP